MPSVFIDLQVASEASFIPSIKQLAEWASLAIKKPDSDSEEYEMTVRVVDEQESQSLNSEYRDKHKPTNVLSFPFEAPAQIALNLLGDLVICAPVVKQEAEEQDKSELAHWAHMVIHGTLHLQGYDHIEEQEALEMEQIEIELLSQLGFSNPYR